MSNSPPFIDQSSSTLDFEQIREEVFPLLGLVVFFGGLALLTFLFALVFSGTSAFGLLFMVLTQLVLAVGGGIVLMYVVARGIQLAGE